jgi:hypothetical protein
MIKTNDLKRGARILLDNGWEADIMDNMKGNTRLCRVYGIETDIGSVYSHDISKVLIGDQWHDVTHTKEQVKLKEQIERIFG